MPFVVSTSTEKPDPEVRKLIRSHVMLGKNQGKTRRPRKREVMNSVDKSSHDQDLGRSSESSIIASHSVIPPKVGSNLSTVQFAEAVEPEKVEVVLRCELRSLPTPTVTKHVGRSRLSVSAGHIAHLIHLHTSFFHR